MAYEIKLGVSLDTSKLNEQIGKLNGKHKIKLGVDLKVNDIRDRIRAYNGNSNNSKIKLGVKLDTADLKRQIQNLNVASGNKKLLSIDTSSLNSSLDKVEKNINDIKVAMGTLDSSSGMKSLLASINQISTALERAEVQFKELNASLNTLANKNFSINFGFNMGNSRSNPVKAMTDYGREARKNTIPQLQEQAAYLQNLLGGYQKADAALERYLVKIHKANGIRVKNNLIDDMADTTSINKQMEAIERYIGYLKKLASMKGVSLDNFNKTFTSNPDKLVEDTLKIQTGAKQAEDSLESLGNTLKGVFSSGINAEKLSTQLDSIVVDLKEIKTSLQDLSQGASLNGLTQSFNNLSASIEKLVGNATQARNVLNSGLGTSTTNTGTQKAIQEQNQLAQTTTQTANAVVESSQRVQQAFTQMTSAGQLDALNLQDDISEADKFAAALSRLKNIQRNIGKVEIGNINTSNGVQQLSILESKLESLSAEYNETVAEINGMGGVNATQLQAFQNQADTTGLKLEQLRAKYADLRAQLERNIKGSFTDYDTQLIKLEGRINNLTSKTPELQQALDRVKQSLATLKEADSTDDLIASNEQYLSLLRQVTSQVAQLEATEKQSTDSLALHQSKQQALLTLQSLFEKNSQAARIFGNDVRELRRRIDACGTSSGMKAINKDISILRRQIKNANVETQSFATRFKNQISKYSTYFSGYMLFTYGLQAMRSMFNQVKSIDSAMTELKKVTDETEATYDKFLTNAATKAKEIGTTIDGLVKSTADFARLGYGFEDAQGLAKVANIYAVVGDEVEGVEGATQSLISTMAAFKDSAGELSNEDFAMSIIDKFNEIGNTQAISSGGIGEALKRSASSLDAANNTLDESIALITAANTVVGLCHAA